MKFWFPWGLRGPGSPSAPGWWTFLGFVLTPSILSTNAASSPYNNPERSNNCKHYPQSMKPLNWLVLSNYTDSQFQIKTNSQRFQIGNREPLRRKKQVYLQTGTWSNAVINMWNAWVFWSIRIATLPKKVTTPCICNCSQEQIIKWVQKVQTHYIQGQMILQSTPLYWRVEDGELENVKSIFWKYSQPNKQ